MKKTLFSMMGMLAVLIALLVMGCVSSKTYDESLPPSKQCTLIVDGSTGHGITLFDGQQVSWKPPFALIPFMASCKVTLPAGKHTLSNGIFQPVEYTFVAGKTYRVSLPFGSTVLGIKEEG